MLLNLVVKNLINLQRLMAAHQFRVNKTSTARGVAQVGGGRGSAQACCHSFSSPALITNLSQVALTVVYHNAQRHLWPQSRSKEEASKGERVKGGGMKGVVVAERRLTATLSVANWR